MRQQIADQDGLTLLECAGSLQEGLLYGLSLPQLAEGLDAGVLLVHLWQDSCSVDALLAAKQTLGDRLVGVVLNAVTLVRWRASSDRWFRLLKTLVCRCSV